MLLKWILIIEEGKFCLCAVEPCQDRMKCWGAEISFILAFYSHFSRIRGNPDPFLLLIKLFQLSIRLFIFFQGRIQCKKQLVKKKDNSQAVQSRLLEKLLPFNLHLVCVHQSRESQPRKQCAKWLGGHGMSCMHVLLLLPT